MCSDAGPGAAGFSATALAKSIPEQTSHDAIRQFKSLAANTSASRPAGTRLRRPASKFADDEVSLSHLAEVSANHLAEVAVVLTHLADVSANYTAMQIEEQEKKACQVSKTSFKS